MPVVKRRLLLVLALSFGSAAADPPAGPAPAGDAALAGLWESTQPLGPNAALWLGRSGDAIWGTGLFTDGTYVVRENRISVRFELPFELPIDQNQKEEPKEQPLGDLTASRWTREVGNIPHVSERVGTSDRVTVEGVWTTMHRMGRTAYERYEPGGALQLRTQIGPGLAGTWTRKGEAVEVRWKDGTRSTLKVVGETLHVPSSAMTPVQLTRRGAENWYALRPEPAEFAAGRAPQSDREVPGLWENASKSRGGIGGAWWFEPSGRALAASLIVVDATYELKDGRLIMRAPDSPKAAEMPLGDVGPTTWRSEAVGVAKAKERIGPAVDPPSVVGTWRYPHDAGGTAYERYGADGRMQFRLLLVPADIGTWSRDEDVLEVRWPHAPPSRFRVEGGSLFGEESAPKEPYAVRRGDEDWYRITRGWGLEPSRMP